MMDGIQSQQLCYVILRSFGSWRKLFVIELSEALMPYGSVRLRLGLHCSTDQQTSKNSGVWTKLKFQTGIMPEILLKRVQSR